MRNRPLLSVCLIILCVLASCTLVGKERFIKELRPSPLEICTTEDESVIVCGVIYRQEQKENGQIIYLKHNSVYSISNKQKFQESKIIVYINSKEKLHIGNRIKVQGTVSFYENARNPGNFDQKFYYQKQGIHGKIYGSQMQITDKSVTSAVFAFSERSMKRLKCSLNTFAARLTASSGSSVPFVYTSSVSLS